MNQRGKGIITKFFVVSVLFVVLGIGMFCFGSIETTSAVTTSGMVDVSVAAVTRTPLQTATPSLIPDPYASSFYVSRFQATDASTFTKYQSNTNDNWVNGVLYLNYHIGLNQKDLLSSNVILELKVSDSDSNEYKLSPSSNNVSIKSPYQSIPLNLISPKADQKYTLTVDVKVDGNQTSDSGKTCEFILYSSLQAMISPSGALEEKNGNSVQLTATASGGAGMSTYKYQWYRVTSSGETAITGETKQLYQARVDGKVKYLCKVSDSIDTVSTLPVEICAVCTISYDIGFDGDVPDVSKKRFGEPFQVPNGPERYDYTFQYWQGSDGRSYNPGDLYTDEVDLRLLAVWKSKKGITAVLDNKDNEIVFGKIARIKISNTDGRPVSLISSDENILKPIDDNKVKAVGFGKAKLTVILSGSEEYKEEKCEIKDILVLPPVITGFKLKKKSEDGFVYTWKDTVKSLNKKKKNNSGKYKLRYAYSVTGTEKGKDSEVKNYANIAKIPYAYKGKSMTVWMFYTYKGDTIEGEKKKVKIGK